MRNGILFPGRECVLDLGMSVCQYLSSERDLRLTNLLSSSYKL